MSKQTFCSLSLCWHTFSASWENGLWTFGGRNSARPRAFRQSMKSLVRRIIAMATGHGQLISSKVYYNTEDSQTYSGNISKDTVCSPRYIGTCINNPRIKDTPLLGTLSNYNTGLFSYVTVTWLSAMAIYGHVTVTWLSAMGIYGHVTVTWLSAMAIYGHVTVTWLSAMTIYGHVTVTWLSAMTIYGHVTVTWLSAMAIYGHVTVTWLSAMAIYGHVTVTWLSAMANPRGGVTRWRRPCGSIT